MQTCCQSSACRPPGPCGAHSRCPSGQRPCRDPARPSACGAARPLCGRSCAEAETLTPLGCAPARAETLQACRRHSVACRSPHAATMRHVRLLTLEGSCPSSHRICGMWEAGSRSAHLSVRGGEGSLAGGGSLVTAWSLAGEGEGGPERDMVGVGLSTPDTEASARDACTQHSESQELSFRLHEFQLLRQHSQRCPELSAASAKVTPNGTTPVGNCRTHCVTELSACHLPRSARWQQAHHVGDNHALYWRRPYFSLTGHRSS